MSKIGRVLQGGGARGADQVGIRKAINTVSARPASPGWLHRSTASEMRRTLAFEKLRRRACSTPSEWMAADAVADSDSHFAVNSQRSLARAVLGAVAGIVCASAHRARRPAGRVALQCALADSQTTCSGSD